MNPVVASMELHLETRGRLHMLGCFLHRGLARGDTCNACSNCSQNPLVQPIMHPTTILASFHHASAPQRRHMVREGRLGDIEAFENLACAMLLPVGKCVKNAQPIRIRKGLKTCRENPTIESPCTHALPQLKHKTAYLLHDSKKSIIIFARRIFHVPIAPMSTRDDRTLYTAPHGNHHVNR